MKKIISLILSVMLVAAMMPMAFAEDASNATMGDFSTLKSAYDAAGLKAVTLSEQTYSGVNSYTSDSTWGAAYIADNSTLTAGLYDAKRNGGELLWTFAESKKLSGVVLSCEAIYGRQMVEISYYNVFVTDTAGTKHVIYDMNYTATGHYAVNITVPESIGEVTSFGIEIYSNEKLTELGGEPVSGYTSNVFNEIWVYEAEDAGDNSNATVGADFAAFQSYEKAFLEPDGSMKLNGKFTFTGDNTDVSGGDLTTKAAALYDGNASTTAMLWGSGDRSADYVWTASEAQSVSGIGIYTAPNDRDTKDSISYYKVYVEDADGNKHYLYNMDSRATAAYAVKIEVPETIGAVTKVGIDPYTEAQIALDGYTPDDEVSWFCEFAIYGQDPEYDVNATATVGGDMLDFVNAVNAFAAVDNGEVLNPELTYAGDLNASIGIDAVNPETFYDWQGTYALMWNGRKADYVWSSDVPVDVEGIALYTEQLYGRGAESISFYKVFVTDMAGKKHYVYDMDHISTTSKCSVAISIPEEYLPVKNVGIEQYTKDQVTAINGTCSDDAFILMEFMVIGKISALVSQGKTVTAVTPGGMYDGTPSNITDGSTNTSAMMYALMTYTDPCYYLIDLGESMPIADVQIVSRSYNNVGELNNLQIRGTNDPNASFTDMVQLSKVTDTFPKENKVDGLNMSDTKWASTYRVGETDSFRYIAIGNEYGERSDGLMIIAEAKVYAYAAETGAPALNITDAEGEALEGVTDAATAKAVVTVKKGTDTEDNMILAVAQYDANDNLINVHIEDVDTTEMKPWDVQAFDAPLTMEGNSGYIKAFLWNAEDYAPVCAGITTKK